MRVAQTFILGLIVFTGSPLFSAAADDAIDFSRDVRPILSNTCFKCHGPDEATREAELRLDTAEGAYANREGRHAIKPGDVESSKLIVRVTSGDPDFRMPPVDSGLELTAEQIDLLRRWVSQGAHYDQHWAFRLIRRPGVPSLPESEWIGNPIDSFVERRLQQAGLAPSATANPSTLIRRVYLDLLGLPPTPEEVEAFISDSQPGSYGRMVERVLANPHYGERWGRHWLDQARYADTNGYSIDSDRSIWPFRDWVINALNAEMPFDQFTIEQLGGDLFSKPTQDQLVATGFHRNTLVNQEGGTDKEQFRNEAVVDRVNTTGAVWLGLTVGCAQCHQHKYDPLTQREYYQLFAFFNSGQDVNSTSPTMSLTTDQDRQRLADFDKQIAAAKQDQANAKDAKKEDREQLVAKLKQLEDAKKKYAAGIPSTMVMRDLDKPRQTNILIRGDFLRKGDPVQANGPAFLSPMVDTDARRTRLDLAKWLVRQDNPLTARVTVNRAWVRFFGQGLVETENDFGIQGTPPTHPELLDWMAAEFMESGWSMKHLHRLIVNSATYRQSSIADPERQSVDPLNKLLWRQNRMRVDAEIVRDLSLTVSGLLNEQLGGKSVYPPQPGGVYAFTQVKAAWPTSKGADRYRRGMYTFFRRSVPYPMLTTFDVPRLNTTCTQRVRSNTPLQSLTMANDQAILEHVWAFGKRLHEFSGDDQTRIEFAYQLCFSRRPSASESEVLLNFIRDQREDFAANLDDAKALIGETDLPAELAVWTVVARVMVNLDEFITRE
jgi:hypothetical protein